MERKEIEAELNEVERDLADIARRAHIAASNLRSVADAAYGYTDADAWQLIQYATALDSVKADVRKMKIELAETKASLFGAKPATVAAGEGGCGMKRLDELGVSPAPWFTVDDETLVCRWIDEEESVLSDVADCGRAADARLIAATPSLYEALTAMLSCAEKNAPYLDMSHMEIAMDMARKAIRQARGEE